MKTTKQTSKKQTAPKSTKPAGVERRDYVTTKDGKKLTLDSKSIAGVGRTAILQGLNNAEVVMAIVGAHPDFPAERRNFYARWYRAQLVMLGVIDAKDPRASDLALRRGDTDAAKPATGARRAKKGTAELAARVARVR